ncbi:uncharacterized protein LOC5667116 isoform X1 [Anopheles gambiae]|uniref:uncharacterized protein LOC5667116 isoform X1 n=1 Tax=Anopheles gambiae TaxID=7165 RepID=UPI002AC910DE|nr:uncharacterized protein LOC5667116 isoform X1 [Anopheles gambiae]
MGDDVICIDSDEDEEADEAPVRVREPIGNRAHRFAGARGRTGGRHRWQRRKAQRGRKNDFTASSTSNCNNSNDTPLGKLLNGLRWLSSEMYFGEWAGKSGPDFPFHVVAQRVRSLVAEFQRFAAMGLLTMPERTEGWRQVVRFLVLLRTVGLTEVAPNEDVDPGCHHRGDDNQQSIDGVGRSRTNHKSKPGVQQSDRSAASGGEKARQTRRYQLTVIDILADYIRFRCESVTGLHPPVQPATLLRECNRIVGSMFVIFDGSMELMALTLLRLPPDRQHTLLLYPVFENVLTQAGTAPADYDTIPGYVRMLLCYKRWKSLVHGRDEKAAIDAHANRLLPGRCPTVRHTSDLCFLRLLPPVPPGQRAAETRYLLVNDLFNLEHCIAQFRHHHRRTSVGGHTGGRDESTAKQQRDNGSNRQRHLQSMEIRSNYINVPLLAELIERKGQLWSRADAGCLQQEAHSIIESLRLIFRNRAEFIQLTLLRVKCNPAAGPALLGPVFEAFLGTTAAMAAGTTATTSTGLTIYRSNDVETYGRLLLCYAKWKSLYWREEGATVGEPTEWADIDAVALTQLPYDFPRAICPRDALLRRIFPSGAKCNNAANNGAGVAPVDASKRNNATTRTLLRTLPKRSDLQELCLKFAQAYRCGPDASLPVEEASVQEQQATHTPTTSSAAYKSPSSSTERSLRWHLSADDVSGQPTGQAGPCPAECRSEMKPISIPDSDDADETSTGGNTSSPVKEIEHNIAAQILLPSLRSTTCTDTYTATGMDRHSPSIAPPDEFVTDAATPPLTVWPTFGECFLNTPPATPQHELPPEAGDEEQQQQQQHHHRRNAPVKKSFPSPSWTRLKGTIRSVGRRKKRTTVTGIVKRALVKVFAHDGWWNFADILAVKIRSPIGTIQRCSSIMDIIGTGKDAVRNMVTNDRVEVLSADAAEPSRLEDASRRSSSKGDDRSKDDALLCELIDCLGAVDTMPFESKQGYVDFAILPDNLGHGAERSQSDVMDDQASPSSCGSGCGAMSPLFAADSDKYVLLFTELGPVSWPIV